MLLHFDDLAIPDMNDLISEGCQVVIVGNHYHGLPLFMDYPLHELQNFQSRVGIQVSRGLIRKYYLRINDQRPCNTDSLLLTSGHLSRSVVQELSEAHHLEHLDSPLLTDIPGNPLECEGHRHILDCCQVRHQVVGLEYKSHMCLTEHNQLALILSLYMLTGYYNLSLCGRFKSGHHVKKRGFSRTGGSHYTAELSFFDGKINSVQCPDLIFTDAIYLI